MKARSIKTVDVTVKEWFDRINGNSYFSGEVIINYGLSNPKMIKLPFQYGYGDHYRYVALDSIKKELNCLKKYNSYWRAFQDNKIIARYNKYENCKKSELLN